MMMKLLYLFFVEVVSVSEHLVDELPLAHIFQTVPGGITRRSDAVLTTQHVSLGCHEDLEHDYRGKLGASEAESDPGLHCGVSNQLGLVRRHLDVYCTLRKQKMDPSICFCFVFRI